ncbi:MAG: bifunctional hydroxymethylpyrimidine kinase/phosphomethylpyrimidine kinase [Spirochaetota bacterium]
MKTSSYIRNVLSIAGSDSGGGAGIQADLKTITALGCFGMTVITAITAQNTLGVIDYMPVPLDMIEKQFDAVASDIPIHAAKTGMLATPDIVKLVATKIKQFSISNCVVDPVMVAKGGSKLLSDDAIQSVIQNLIPVAHVVTPNIHEAEVLTGITIKNIDDMKDAAKKIYSFGARYVVVKGGHLESDPSDVIYDGKNFTVLKNQRIETKNTHGTGCTFSSAIATYVAKGYNTIEAITKAKEFITKAITFSLPLGKGHGPTNHLVAIVNNEEKIQVVEEIQKAFSILHAAKCGQMFTSGVSNIAYTLPYVTDTSDIAMFPGGIIVYNDSIFRVKDPAYGVDHQMALFMQKITPMNYRAAINIKNEIEYKINAQARGIPVYTSLTIDNLQEITISESNRIVCVEIKQDNMLYIIGNTPFEIAETLLKIKKSENSHA